MRGGVHTPLSSAATPPTKPYGSSNNHLCQECHAAFFSLKGLILLLMRCGWYGPSKYASVHMAICSPQPAH